MSDEVISLISFYAREGYWRHVRNIAGQVARKVGSAPILRLWRACALLQEGASVEAIRELTALVESSGGDGDGSSDTTLAALIALQRAHNKASVIDGEAATDVAQRLQQELGAGSRSRRGRGLLLAATIAWHLGDAEGPAQEWVEQFLLVQPGDLQAQCLRAWLQLYVTAAAAGGGGKGMRAGEEEEEEGKGVVEISSRAEEDINSKQHNAGKEAQREFEELSKVPGAHVLDALLGLSKALQAMRMLRAAADVLSRVSAQFPWFLPAQALRARLLARHSGGDWDVAIDAARLVLSADANNIEALRVEVLYDLSQDRGSREASAVVEKMKTLAMALKKGEPKDATLWVTTVRPIAWLCARGDDVEQLVLKETIGLCLAAQALQPTCANWIVEHGHQTRTAGDISGALAIFRRAAAAASQEITQDGGDVSFGAIYGEIRCLIQLKQLDKAGEQILFLEEMTPAIDDTATFNFLRGLYLWEKEPGSEDAARQLHESVREHLALVKQKNYSMSTNNERVVFPGDSLGEEFEAYAVAVEVADLYLDYAGVSDVVWPLPQPKWAVASPAAAITSMASSAPSSVWAQQAARLMAVAVRLAPGSFYAQCLLGRALLKSGDTQGSTAIATELIRSVTGGRGSSSNRASAYLLQAEIAILDERPNAVAAALEAALAQDFRVRERPLYHILEARRCFLLDDYDSAQQGLETAMALLNMKVAAKSVSHSATETATLYLLLAAAYSRGNRAPEAGKVIQDALVVFSGTAQEVRFTIADCGLCAARGDVSSALARLRAIGSDSPGFLAARLAMADLYLHHSMNVSTRKDPEQYIACFEELAAELPSARSQKMLGDALLAVYEPERAVKAFEAAAALATERDTQNKAEGGEYGGVDGAGVAHLHCAIGKALAMTHDFEKALSYYRRSLQTATEKTARALRKDYSAFCLKMGNFEEAEEVCHALLASNFDSSSKFLKNEADEANWSAVSQLETTESIQDAIDALDLWSQILNRQGKATAVLTVKKKIRELQLKVALIVREAQYPEAATIHITAAAETCYEIARICDQAGDFVNAEEYYKDAVQNNPEHIPSQVALAALYLCQNKIKQCQQHCMSLLKKDPTNEGASMILARVMARKGNTEAAIAYFKPLLNRPHNPSVAALEEVVGLLYRSGRLDEVPDYLEETENALRPVSDKKLTSVSNEAATVISPLQPTRLRGITAVGVSNTAAIASQPIANTLEKPTQSIPKQGAYIASALAGIRYCRGIYLRNKGKAEEALQMLSTVRKDSTWGYKATIEMVDISLYHDGPLSRLDETIPVESYAETVQISRDLLEEIPSSRRDTTLEVWKNLTQIAFRRAIHIEKAIDELSAIASENKENAFVLLALATAFLLQGQNPKARNCLKRIQKLPFKEEDLRLQERAWLLLSRLYADTGKHDLARDLCQRALRYNLACVQAWELLGCLMEKEKAYKDAADSYEHAWKYSSTESSSSAETAAIGYRLAFNYLKAERYMEAVEVCRAVLRSVPDYPRIREDILDRARSALRA